MNHEPLIQVSARIFEALDVKFERAEAYLIDNDPLTRNGNCVYIDINPFLERMNSDWNDGHVIAVAEILAELDTRLMFKLNGHYIGVGSGSPSQILIETILSRIFLDYFEKVDFEAYLKGSGNTSQGDSAVENRMMLNDIRRELKDFKN